MSRAVSIWLIEDEPSLVSLYSVALAKVGQVTTATNQTEAEALIQAVTTANGKKPDIILLDLILPEQPNAPLNFGLRVGFRLLEQLKQQASLRAVPVIVMTNLDSAEDRLQAKHLGAKDYIIKSNIEPKAIAEHIHAAL